MHSFFPPSPLFPPPFLAALPLLSCLRFEFFGGHEAKGGTHLLACLVHLLDLRLRKPLDLHQLLHSAGEERRSHQWARWTIRRSERSKRPLSSRAIAPTPDGPSAREESPQLATSPRDAPFLPSRPSSPSPRSSPAPAPSLPHAFTPLPPSTPPHPLRLHEHGLAGVVARILGLLDVACANPIDASAAERAPIRERARRRPGALTDPRPTYRDPAPGRPLRPRRDGHAASHPSGRPPSRPLRATPPLRTATFPPLAFVDAELLELFNILKLLKLLLLDRQLHLGRSAKERSARSGMRGAASAPRAPERRAGRGATPRRGPSRIRRRARRAQSK